MQPLLLRGERFAMATMALVADRFEAPGSDGWVNLRLDAQTGDDFPDDDPLRGSGMVYGWIQGRAMEALARHVVHLESAPPLPGVAPELTARLRGVLAALVERVQAARAHNAGHLFFTMTPDGQPFRMTSAGERAAVELRTDSPVNYSDLFAAKGLLAAAGVLRDDALRADAIDYLRRGAEGLLAGDFLSDQQPLDPANPVVPVPGRHSLGPHMLHLGSAFTWLENGGGDEAAQLGAELLQHLFDLHVCDTPFVAGEAALRPGDTWEFVTDDGAPWQPDGCLLADPGHALEAVGLAWKFILAVERAGLAEGPVTQAVRRARVLLPQMLRRNFANGFNATAGGVSKLVDLHSRRVVNGDMPWWSLPETMRAALLTAEAAPARAHQAVAIFRTCHEAFFNHYVTDESRGLALQTRNAAGGVSSAIPATADLDPGYHTGLSLLDCAACLERLSC